MNRPVLLVSSDLSARARVVDAAARLGLEVVTSSPRRVAEAVRDQTPGVVVLDLDEGRLPLLEAAGGARTGETRVIGFVSHVDRELFAAARGQGCEPLPRGRFWRTLPDLLAEVYGKTRSKKGGDMAGEERPAAPQQPEHGFEEGLEQKPDSPEEHEGDFAEGLRRKPELADERRHPRFSEGEEELGDTPDKRAERRFSEGQEHPEA